MSRPFFDPPKPKYPFPPPPPVLQAPRAESDINVWNLLPVRSAEPPSSPVVGSAASNASCAHAEPDSLCGEAFSRDPCMPVAERLWYGQVGVFEQDLQQPGDQLPDENQAAEGCEQELRQPSIRSPAGGQASDLCSQSNHSEADHEGDLACSWQQDLDQGSQKNCSSAGSFEVVNSVPVLGQLEARVGNIVPHLGAVLVDNVSHLKLPWEQGIYKPLFEDFPFNNSLTVPGCPFAPPLAPASSGPLERAAAAVSTCRAFSAFKQLDDVSYDERMAKRAEVSLGRLVAFFDALPNECKPESWPLDYAACVEYLQASVGVRSALTIEKRSNSLVQYLRWASLEGITANLFAEATFWAYIQHLKRTFAPASRGPAVASALRFAQRVLGVRYRGAFLSRRCLGALEQLEAANGPVRQASPLIFLSFTEF